MRIFPLLIVACVSISVAKAEIDYDFGADLRIRQELMENVPGLPNGGRSNTDKIGKYKNWIRFRPRVWGEVKGTTQSGSSWRLYTRLTDEIRWTVRPHVDQKHAWPGELLLDNLFLEGKGLFDGLLDISVGRQDSVGLYGLDHIFYDGTPGDGSRAMYMDLVRLAFNFDDDRRLDLFATYNSDRSDVRLARKRNRIDGLTGLGGAEPKMDDWGFGAIWNDHLAENVPVQLFAMHKNTLAYSHPKYGRRPATHRTLFGTKLKPQLTDEWSLDLELMAQVGWNGNKDTLHGESAYVGAMWKDRGSGWRQFTKYGYRFMSGSDDAASEDGGHGSWDPMWSRGPTEADFFLWGAPYGTYWWSNMHYLKATYGVDFGRLHYVSFCTGPVFSAARDRMGGGDGVFKGMQSQLKYAFPIYLTDESEGRGFDVFAYIQFELFNPGDYYSSEKPSWFVRWQVDFKF